jgi:hypothetical protein
MTVKTIPHFEREAKNLIKKYRSLSREIAQLIIDLEQNPIQGTSLGRDCYKIRLAIVSKNAGKSGGARVITCVKIKNGTAFLVSIYDKSEQEDISGKELTKLLTDNQLI